MTVDDTGGDSPDTVEVRVERLLPFGMLVRLADDRSGLIREREIAWDFHERRTWQQRFHVGDVLPAVPIGTGLDDRLELSLRLAENDPWVDIERRFPLGEVVDGTVTGVQPYGAFVQLRAGVTGLLHVTRLPLWARGRPTEELFWVGDRVRVIVERIDLSQRRLGLSLGRAYAERWRGREEPTPHAHPAPHQPEAPQPAAAAEPELPQWSILVVEDDSAQLQALARWLRQSAQHVQTAGSAEEALEKLEDELPDLILTDFGLPNMLGVELIELVRRRWPSVRCALMTGLTRAGEHVQMLDRLRSLGVPVLVKPLLPADVTELLAGRLGGDHEAGEPAAEFGMSVPPELLRGHGPYRQQLHAVLHGARQAAGVTDVLLFALDRGQRKVTILEHAGASTLSMQAAVDLIYSPVRDVAEDQRMFHVEDAQRAETRLRYLRPLLPFRACLGVPLPTQLAEQYALFAFRASPGAFDAASEAQLTAAALAASAIIEREQIRLQAVDVQRLALLGQLSRGLVHELNHQLSPVNFVLGELVQRVGEIERRAERPAHVVDRTVRVMREAVQDLTLSIERLTETARTFSKVTVQSRDQLIAPGEAAAEAVALVRDMADRAHVRLEYHVADDVPAIRAPAVQLQQMLINVVVNAVQQVALARPAEGGRVVVRVRPAAADDHRLVRIEVEDDGPGIHWQLWDRVFELGFTTRHDGGSGLGLYITRGLAEAVGAHVAVVESHMLWGTTFAIDLPA